jgi:hypothetical protein
MYYFLYKTTNILNNKIYVGIHKTKNINDGYIGCGVFTNISGTQLRRQRKSISPFWLAVKKYGVKYFKREIISFFNSYEEALAEERKIIDLEWIKNENNYNVALGGNRGCEGWKMPEEQKKHLSKLFKNKIVSEETRKKISNSNKGLKRSLEHKKKLSILKTKYNLENVYLQIKPYLDLGYSEKKINEITNFSKGTIYRAKNLKKLKLI